MRELIMLAHVPTDSVNGGFIPAAQRIGLSVVLLTDHAEAHRQYFSQPGLAAYPHEIVACDVISTTLSDDWAAGREASAGTAPSLPEQVGLRLLQQQTLELAS